MPRWLIGIVALLLAGPAGAVDVTGLAVVEFGLFSAMITGTVPAPQAVDERTNTLGDVVFYSRTSKVPARLAVHFGTRFRIVGTPVSRVVTLRSVWRIPEPGIVNPETGTHYRQSISDSANRIGETTMLGYGFDAPWEIRCGDWIQEVWFGQRKLLSQTFTVEGCDGVPVSAREPGPAVAVLR